MVGRKCEVRLGRYYIKDLPEGGSYSDSLLVSGRHLASSYYAQLKPHNATARQFIQHGSRKLIPIEYSSIITISLDFVAGAPANPP